MGLGEAGHEVLLHGRRAGPNDGEPGGVALTADFYRLMDGAFMRRVPQRLRLAAKAADHVVSMRALLRRLRRETPDVIHFQWLPLPLLDRAFLGAMARVAPLVLTVHDTKPFNGDPASRLQSLGFLKALRRFHALIVHTEQGRERLSSQGLPDEWLTVLPHGLLQAARVPNVPPAANDPGTTFVLFGKMKPYKGIDVLIEAFARMPASLQANSRMRVVGKPYMDVAPLVAQAERLGVSGQLSIEQGFIDDRDIPELFGPGTVAVFPYREIEASGVLAIAASHGRPMIASRVGAFAETIVEGVNGHLVEANDVAGLAAAMVRMVEDPEHAARCGLAMAKIADDLPRWDEIGRRTAVVYRAAQTRWTAAAA